MAEEILGKLRLMRKEKWLIRVKADLNFLRTMILHLKWHL